MAERLEQLFPVLLRYPNTAVPYRDLCKPPAILVLTATERYRE
ncbi:hypothetical protein [Methanosarcina horonobensis]|nr:hypothetical protein [Methanosarcina horonobensis]